MPAERRDPPAPTDAQPKENGVGLNFFTEGKKLAEEGISSKKGKSLGFFKTPTSKTVLEALYTDVNVQKPYVELTLLIEAQLTTARQGVLLQTIKVGSDGEFVDAHIATLDGSLRDYMQNKANKTFMNNLAAEVKDIPDPDEASPLVEAERIIDDQLRIAESERLVRKSIGEQADTAAERMLDLWLTAKEVELIQRTPNSKFINIMQKTLIAITPAQDNITPHPYAE